ncbi:MAG: hypothetical protein Q9183_001904 [Haloplaca sp. 2 TL-2023]
MAGFSCVDSSKLNKNRKDVTEGGETGDTLRAIIRYARRYRPKILVLENIEGNQWQKIEGMLTNDRKCPGLNLSMLKELWGDDGHPNVGYSCHVSQADSREYNTPQTRRRRYTICVDRSQIGKAAADKLALEWAVLFEGVLPQHASVPAEALLLPAGDPRLQAVYARAHYNDFGQKRKRKTTTWEICKLRYVSFRANAGLGTGRPYTNYTESGACHPPEYWLAPWIRIQVDRVMEHFEQSLLRKVAIGYDPLHKTRIIDLSQNIDRALDNVAEGITTCLTPTMVSLVSTRGGPVTGWEAMRMQGLPADKLLLGRMTESQIKDMAGNAMTTPVIGAAILALLATCGDVLASQRSQRSQRRSRPTKEVVDDRAGQNQAMDGSFLGSEETLDVTSYERTPVRSLMEMANSSRLHCYCETQVENTTSAIYHCQHCEHTCCAQCKSIQVHDYAKMDGLIRERPLDVAARLKKALPMRLCLDGQRISDLVRFDYARRFGNRLDLQIVAKGLKSALLEEFRFLRVKRTRWGWTVHFEGQSLDLQLRLKATEAEWHIYARPHKLLAGISRERELLKRPIARMIVNDQGSDLLDGQWEVCAPVDRVLKLKIDGEKYGKVDSWQNELGILKYDKTQVSDAIDIEARLPEGPSNEHNAADNRTDPDHQAVLGLAERISGHYKLLPRCETACRSLFKKTTPDHDGKHMYFFFDPHRAPSPSVDRYSFAKTHHRLEFKENRDIVARLANPWEPLYPKKEADCLVMDHKHSVNWSLKPFKGGMPVSFALAQDLDLEVSSQDGTSKATGCASNHVALASIRVPTSARPNPDVESELVQSAQQQMLFQINDWVLSRLPCEPLYFQDWQSIRLSKDLMMCHVCAPRLPDLRFKHKIRLNKEGKPKVDPRLTVYEDPKQSADFERGLKKRLPLMMAKWSLTEGRIKTGVNMTSLAHRTLVKMSIRRGDKVQLRYRIRAMPKQGVVTRLPPYALSSTDKVQDPDPQELFFEAGKPQLRPEQRNSVRRMLIQEQPKDFGPTRQQALEEAYVEGHDVHVMMSGLKDKMCLGGVAAHEVGYGKTALILALFHKTQEKNPAFYPPAPRGKISSKATVILVPGTIVRQWKQQVTKFLGEEYNVLTIPNMQAYRKYTVRDIQTADLIIADSALMSSPAYRDTISALSAIPIQSRKNAWAADTWFDRAMKRMDDLITSTDGSDLPSMKNALIDSFVRTCLDPALFRETAASRRVGKDYVNFRTRLLNESLSTKAKEAADSSQKTTDDIEEPADDEAKIREIANARLKCLKLDQTERGLLDMSSPPLQMFAFNRVVVDEVTYIGGSARTYVAGIHALKHWVLSGTPRLNDFTEVNSLASFLDLKLGEDIDEPGVTTEYNVERMRRAFTDTQKFLSAYHHYSMHFHTEQHRSGQAFLDRFARQDEPEIDEIPVTYHVLGVYSSSGQLISAIEIEELSQGDEIPRLAPTQLPDESRTLAHGLLKDHANTIESRLEFYCRCKPKWYGGLLWTTPNALGHRQDEIATFMDFVLYIWRGAILLHRLFHKSMPEFHKSSPLLEWLENIEEDGITEMELKDIILVLIHILRSEAINTDNDIRAYFKGHGRPIDAISEVWFKEHNIERDAEIATWDFEFLHEYLTQYLVNTGPLLREWAERRRELRLYSQALALQKWVADERNEAAPTCSNCERVCHNPDETILLVSCGHVACPGCVSKAISDNRYCLVDYCTVRGTHARPTTARRLGQATGNEYSLQYGAKMGKVIELLEQTIPQDEQVLLFVQFDSVMEEISMELDRAGISNYHISVKATARNRAKWMQRFQEDTGEDARRVLILDATKDSAAGANLTNANHVIFLSTFWTDNQHAYHQSITQCVGRAKRFGQTKRVHVYRIVAMESVEVDLLEWREGKKMVHLGGDKYDLVDWEQCTEDELAQDLTTGELLRNGFLDRDE